MNEMFERAKKSSNEKGITLVITTYRRNSTLKTLLKSLLRQQLNIPANLAQNKTLATARFHRVSK